MILNKLLQLILATIVSNSALLGQDRELVLTVAKLRGFDGYIYQTIDHTQRDHFTKNGYSPGTAFYMVEKTFQGRQRLEISHKDIQLDMNVAKGTLVDWHYRSARSRTEMLDIDADGYLDCRRLDLVDSQLRVGKRFLPVINHRDLSRDHAITLEKIPTAIGKSFVFQRGEWREANEESLSRNAEQASDVSDRIKFGSDTLPVSTINWQKCTADEAFGISEFPCSSEFINGDRFITFTSLLGHKITLRGDRSGTTTFLAVNDLVSWEMRPDSHGKCETSALVVRSCRYVDADGDGRFESVEQPENWQLFVEMDLIDAKPSTSGDFPSRFLGLADEASFKLNNGRWTKN